ncbi:hypothetical protein TNCV_1263341 [Trichonephila clavipes]|nr:hypothetical protein TNCV_1263341 [Trichonephila clavipes]
MSSNPIATDSTPCTRAIMRVKTVEAQSPFFSSPAPFDPWRSLIYPTQSAVTSVEDPQNSSCDEAHFWLNSYVNKQNGRIWSEANPQVYVETPLHPEKLTVWCALWAGGILLQKR